MRLVDEELSAQVVLRDGLMVDDCDGVDTGEDQVLCDFVCERLDANEEDVCLANAVF